MSDVHSDRRERWARPNGGHDRRVRFLRVALPSAIGALAAYLAIAPLTNRQEVSFVLDKNKVEQAKERMRVSEATYRGQDDRGQPFEVSAGSAVQPTSKSPLVNLGNMAAKVELDDGTARLEAPTARYDMDAERLQIDGPLTVTRADGYRLETSNVAADLNTQTLSSDQRVEGTLPLGRFSAGNMQADLANRTVTLGGRARLHVEQGAAKGRR